MLSVLVVDDEAPARELLCDQLEEHRVVGQAANGMEALRMAAALRPDVILLDIHMPGMSGLDVARELRARPSPPHLVFLTAYDQHALQAFELQAVDYLLKPVDPLRLQRTLQRLQPCGEPQRLALLDEASGVRYVVDLDDIAWFTSQEERTYARTARQTLRSMETLAALEARLPRDRFVRTHRSYLVNMSRVTEVIPWASGAFNLRLRGMTDDIPLSRNHAPAFKAHAGWS